MAYKLVISKPGYNVLTETDNNNLVFSSDYNTLKYYTNGSINVGVNVGEGYYQKFGTISHNLGYKPFYLVYGNWVSWGPVGIFYVATSDYSIELTAGVDNNNLYVAASGFVVSGTTASYTAEFKYKIFKNNLGL